VALATDRDDYPVQTNEGVTWARPK
jgi:hypothetical protein